MYLYRVGGDYAIARKIEDILEYEAYLSCPKTLKKGRPYSFKEYFGYDKPDIPEEVRAKYEAKYITRYPAWDTDKVCPRKTIVEGVAYWRKANEIHRWFVDNVQKGVDDCGTYKVTRKQLKTLLTLCKDILSKAIIKEGLVKNGATYKNGKWSPNMEPGEFIANPEVCSALPTSEGFFFGSTEYDQWYLRDIEYTVEAISSVLKNTDFREESVYYHASW